MEFQTLLALATAEIVEKGEIDGTKRGFVDHRKAVIVTVTGKGEEIELIEAKDELKERIEGSSHVGRVVGVETVDRMTDRQIAAKVRQHFAE